MADTTDDWNTYKLAHQASSAQSTSLAGYDPSNPYGLSGDGFRPVTERLSPEYENPNYHASQVSPMTGGQPTQINLNNALAGLYSMDGKTLHDMQDSLYLGGFYDARANRHDMDETKKAYVRLLARTADYNVTDPFTTITDVLKKSIDNTSLDGGPDGSGAAKSSLTSTTDPAGLALTLQSAAASKLGRKLSDGDVSRFVSMFHGLEASANATQRNVALNGGVANVTQPDASGQAAQFVSNNFANEEAGMNVLGYMKELHGLLGGG